MNVKACFLLGAFMVLCHCLSAQPSNRMLRQVPGEAMFVSHINTGALNEKVDVDRLKGLPIIDYYYKKFKQSTGKDSVLVSKIYNDPENQGISLTPYIYMFFDLNVDLDGEDAAENIKESGPPQFYTVIPLSSRRKFQHFIEQILKEEYDDFVKKEWGYKYYYKRDFGMAWSRKFLVLTSGGGTQLENAEETFKEIFDRTFKVKRKESLLKQDDYATAQAERNDLGLWFNIDRIIDISEKSNEMDESAMKMVDDFRGSHTAFNLNFANGKIVLENITDVEGELSPYTQQIYNARINPKMLHYIEPGEMLSASGFALNMKAIKDYVEDETHEDALTDSLFSLFIDAYKDEMNDGHVSAETAIEVTEEAEETESAEEAEVTEKAEAEEAEPEEAEEEKIEEEAEEETMEEEEMDEDDELEVLFSPEEDVAFEEIIDSTLQEFHLEQEDLWTLFKGDILVGLTGTYEEVDTFFTYEYIENEDGEFVYDEVEKTEKKRSPYLRGMMSTGDPSMLRDVFLKLDSLDYVDADGDRFKTIQGGPAAYIWIVEEDSLLIVTNEEEFNPEYDRRDDITENGAIAAYMKDYPFFFHMDYEQITELYNLNGKEEKLNNEALKYFSGLSFISELTGNNDLRSEASIVLKNPKDNSLHQLFDIINGFYEQMSGGRR